MGLFIILGKRLSLETWFVPRETVFPHFSRDERHLFGSSLDERHPISVSLRGLIFSLRYAREDHYFRGLVRKLKVLLPPHVYPSITL